MRMPQWWYDWFWDWEIARPYWIIAGLGAIALLIITAIGLIFKV